MKKTFKGLMVVAFAFVLLLGLTGCGEQKENNDGGNGTQGGNQQQEQQTGTAIKDVTVSNWAAVVKDNFLLDLALPEGWEVTKAYSPNNVGNIKALFKTGGTTTGEDLAKEMFEKSKALGEVSPATFEEAGSVKGIKTWTYKTSDLSVKVNAYYDVEGTFEITLNK